MRLATILLSCLLTIAAARGTHRLFDVDGDHKLHTALVTRADKATTNSVREAFYAAKVVPDVLPSFDPTLLLNVNFTNSGLEDPSVTVEPGVLLTRNQTKFIPEFSISNITEDDGEKTYVVVQVDPDAHTPQNPDVAQVRHLLGGNYTTDGTAATGLALRNSSVAVSEWMRPSPPAGSDPHRYVILLYAQPDNFSAASIAPLVPVNASSSPLHFNLSEFAQATGLGLPVAGTYFLTGPDAASA
ncbi:phosphatidylethanolamine-binding protein [Schizophyllum amplum]|uniref:Phosphatidylethanolamine-binding protein n=1 Tax=Schizophyllum amplum TaxID=97359 RepID=A0A550D002_9AGAR|nr:phosphatidylethanolamine-binding protein [Auriculariopsis ampla]